MHGPVRFAVAAVAVLAVAVGGLFIANRSPGGGVGGSPATAAPSPSPSASAPPISPSPSSGAVDLHTAAWTTYTSDRYGFSIGHPVDWTERPSDHVWADPADLDWLTTASEGFKAPGDTVLATAWSVAVKPGTTLDSWLATYCPRTTAPCQGATFPATMDGHAGRLMLFTDDTQAFMLVADRMYVVAVWEPDSDPRTAQYGGARHLLEGYLSTMRLLPGGPASPAPTATARPTPS